MLAKGAEFERVDLDRIKRMSLEELQFFGQNIREYAHIADVSYVDYLKLKPTRRAELREEAKRTREYETESIPEPIGYSNGYKINLITGEILEEPEIPSDARVAYENFRSTVLEYDTKGSRAIQNVVGYYIEEYGADIVGEAIAEMPEDLAEAMTETVKYQGHEAYGIIVKEVAQYFKKTLEGADLSEPEYRYYGQEEYDSEE